MAKTKQKKQKRNLTELPKKTENKKQTPTLTLEDRINNEFDEMAVSVAYGKNEGEKLKAVRAFNTFIDNNVPSEDRDKIKALVEERLKDNDFIYGSEFIDLSSLKEYADRLFEERKVEKEFETHSSKKVKETKKSKKKETSENLADVVKSVKDNANNTLGGILSGLAENAAKREEHKMPRPNPNKEAEKALHQALLDGIANEEIKNIKGYSNDDLKKILEYHDKLLYADDGNGTAFESLYDNSIADLKKFAEGKVSIDNDSYETMMQFIKTFGTNSKGQLLPEGKAAYDKLMNLMAEQQKQKILANKEKYQAHAEIVKNVQNHANNTLAGILGGLAANASKREKAATNSATSTTTPKTTKEEAPTEFAIGDEEAKDTTKVILKEKQHQEPQKNENKTYIPVTPTSATTNKNSFTPENTTNETPKPQPEEKKKGFWGKTKDWLKDKWKKIAAITALAAAALLLPKSCTGNGNNENKNQDRDIPEKTTVIPSDSIAKPTPADTLQLTPQDLSNGFYLERSAGFKGEQEGISFKDAEKANKQDLLTIKRLMAQKKLDINKFKRHTTSQNKEPITVTEIAYKMRVVMQNFPGSKIAKSMENIFSGKVSERDQNNLYGAFTHINDYGQLIDRNGEPINTIDMEKEISAERFGKGSEEYGTEGTDNNFIQVLKKHKDILSK